jgi:hypothetical protein
MVCALEARMIDRMAPVLSLILALGFLGSGCLRTPPKDDPDSTATDDVTDDSGKTDDSSIATDDSGETDDSGKTDDSGTNDDSGRPPSPGRPVINEVLAMNWSSYADERGEYDDWIELYNIGESALDLTDYQLTDNSGVAEPWTFGSNKEPDKDEAKKTELVLEPGAYLVVWCDSTPRQGATHTDFALDGDKGETLTLLNPDGHEIDEVAFGPQNGDVSWARHPDGGDKWKEAEPTPMEPNP